MSTKDTFRDRIHKAFRMYRATILLTTGVQPTDRTRLDESLSALGQLPTGQLREQWARMEPIVRDTLRKYDVRGTLEQMEGIIQSAEKRADRVILVSKHDLQRLFGRYDRVVDGFDRVPAHARFSIDLHNLETQRSWHLLEASLFEDMAALWNVVSDKGDIAFPLVSKEQGKYGAALKRAAAKAAFNLLEGYLNGVAASILLIRTVTDGERTKLKEWDDQKNRTVYLSLRDKIMQYPRIAVGADSPPIQDSRSVAMRELVRLEKAVRHALIHPDPRAMERESAFVDYPLPKSRLSAITPSL